MSQPKRDVPTPAEEAAQLVKHFKDSPMQMVAFLSGQLSVLKTQAQMIMGMSGLVITVTGFSGHHMVRGGHASTVAMIIGISAVFVGAVDTVRTLGKLRWVSQDLSDDMEQTATWVIERRNHEQTALNRAGALVAVGMLSYLAAVVLAALHNGQS